MDNTRSGLSNRFSMTTFDSLEELARLTLPYLVKGNIALSGGVTYGRLFPLWAGLKPDCRATTFFPVDERIVGFDDPGSNWGTACREFLSKVGKSEDKGNFAVGAQQYGALLKARFGAQPPIFDAVFLGVGDDGHIAGLFPGKRYLDDLNSIVLETASPKPPFHRVTLAMAPLTAAKTLVAIIAGKEKKVLVKRLLDDDDTLPIVTVLSKRKTSLVFVEKSLVA
jgi:6-phosphogluconolactonase